MGRNCGYLKHGRLIPSLALVCGAMVGCAPSWYQRDADRQVAQIVEDRKEGTLGYKPQSEAAVKTSPTPTTQAYEKIPLTVIVTDLVTPLEMLKIAWIPEPLGPKEPPTGIENYDLLPVSYATFGISMDPLGPPAPGVIDINLDLISSVEYAVAHARDYQDRMEELYLATLDVTLQRHLFDPTPFANTTVGYSGNQGLAKNPDGSRGGNAYQSALSVINTVGVKQQLPYGGTIAAQQLVSVTDALSQNSQDGQSAVTALTASIPLLKGAGLVNLEPLISSERQLVYVVRGFETYRRQFAVNIASQFFSLVAQQQSIKNRRQNYVNLRLLTERSAALYAAGRLSYIDVQRAQQNLLSSESSLIDSVNGYQASVDNFKISLGMPIEADLDIIGVEMQVTPPDSGNVDSIGLAMKYRLDLQTARDQVDDARRGVSNSKNGLLPSVTLRGFSGVGNLSGDRFTQYSEDSLNYTAAVSIDWPVDQLSDRNNYRKSLIFLEQSQRQYTRVRDQAIADVRQRTRQIRSAQVTLEIQKRNVELNRRRLDLANDLLLQGKKGTQDVVDAQSALLSAQDGFANARTNLQIQVLQYLRDTGTLRVDPRAGALGRAMDRAAVIVKDGRMFDDIERQMEKR